LATRAAKRLQRLGYDNVELHAGDGTGNGTEEAPFDAV
jgi:protein-L-isoaspartate O-methyltransferase